MIGKVRLLSNYEEIENYLKDVEEYGKDELLMLGKYSEPPTELYTKSEILFDVNDVYIAWIIEEDNIKMINIKMKDNDTWGFYYTDELWNKLMEHFK